MRVVTVGSTAAFVSAAFVSVASWGCIDGTLHSGGRRPYEDEDHVAVPKEAVHVDTLPGVRFDPEDYDNLFVSFDGDDVNGDGTRARPFAHI